MQIDLEKLPNLADIHKRLTTGYHISEQDFALWTELDGNEDAYSALFAALGNQLKLFALTTYALVELFADQGQDPLRALFETEINHEILSSILQQQYHLFEQLEIYSATDLKREVGNRMLRYGFAKTQGDNFKLLPPLYRFLDALVAVDSLQ